MPIFKQDATRVFYADNYGADPTGATDSTAKIQAAINDAHDYTANLPLFFTNRGAIVSLGPGVYAIDKLTLTAGIALVGAGMYATNLIANTLSAPPATATYGMIEIAPDQVQGVRLSDFHLHGTDAIVAAGTAPRNLLQWGIYIKPALSAQSSGGLWRCVIENVAIRNLDGNIWFRGGRDDYTLPNQFISLNNIHGYGRRQSSSLPGLCFTGQSGQVSGSNMRFDPQSSGLGSYSDPTLRAGITAKPGLYIGTEYDLTNTYSLTIGGPGSDDTLQPMHILLNNVTFQDADLAIDIYRGQDIELDTLWLENNNRCIRTRQMANVSVSNPHIANSGANAGGTGYIGRAETSSILLFSGGSYVSGTYTDSYGLTAYYVPNNILEASSATAYQTSPLYTNIWKSIDTRTTGGTIQPSVATQTLTANSTLNVSGSEQKMNLAAALTLGLPKGFNTIWSGTGRLTLSREARVGDTFLIGVVSTATINSAETTTNVSSVDLGYARTAIINTSATTIFSILSKLPVGETITIRAQGGSIVLGSSAVLYLGGASSWIIPQNKFVTLRRFDLGVVWTLDNTTYLQASATYNPPSLTAGTRDTEQSLTVTGAALGDQVTASFSLDLAGCRLEAYVSATNTVKYQFYNPTAGTVDLGSGTVRVSVMKFMA